MELALGAGVLKRETRKPASDVLELEVHHEGVKRRRSDLPQGATSGDQGGNSILV
jgi:hypothetical protein